ncbi:MAG: polysaccharide pyruvyl transferase family protein [Rhodocyclaceae bacterium]|jgi:hypothetical protein|nr:polysaccharide pyruvyl transferase family protein [Rhodocyclaceae bacterium]
MNGLEYLAPDAGREGPPVVIFGPFDRHNLGDLLFPHLAIDRLKARRWICAGLVERDLTADGGHRVVAFSRLAQEWRSQWGPLPMHVIHPGGEILTADAYACAVMILPPEQAGRMLSHPQSAEGARRAWARQALGVARGLPYVLGSTDCDGQRIFAGVGGVDLLLLPAALQDEARRALAGAAYVSVRDGATQSILEGWGIAAPLEPDPVSRLPQACGSQVAAAGKVARQALGLEEGAYGVVHVSAEWGDDLSLATVAAECRKFGEPGLPWVVLGVGYAPWHDDPRVLARLADGLGRDARLFTGRQVWRISGLLAGARQVVSTSLHARIVAEAYQVPAWSLVRDGGQGAKLRAYVETWWGGSRLLNL